MLFSIKTDNPLIATIEKHKESYFFHYQSSPSETELPLYQ